MNFCDENKSAETDEIPEHVDAIAECVGNCKQATKSGNALLASKWYLRAMLRARQDAYCTIQPDSAYGAIQRVHRKLMRILKPLQGIENAPNLELLQHEQLKWLRDRTDSQKLPPPTALLEVYSDPAVGYDPKKAKVARHRRKKRKLEQASGKLDCKTSHSTCNQVPPTKGQKDSTQSLQQQNCAKIDIGTPLLDAPTSAPPLSPTSSLSPQEKSKERENAPISMQMYFEPHWHECRKRFVDERLC